MANTGKTSLLGTVVEVQKKGETAAWEKFVCNPGALDIDFGEYQTSKSEPCLEDGKTEDIFEGLEYSEQTFKYVWTQALTNAADTKIKEAFDTKGVQEVEFRTTMNNKTGSEAVGTTYIIPFKIKAYKHLGNDGKVWTTEIKVIQTGEPVETAAA